MAKKSKKHTFSLKHPAALRAAHAKRRGKKRESYKKSISMANLPIYDPNNKPIDHNDLATRLKNAVDKIEAQINRLENLI